jgi:predicted nucleic acid-binding Zn ribbon protein
MVFPMAMSDSNTPGGPRRRRPNAQLAAAADVLQGLLQNSKSQLADGFLRWRLEHQWESVVGATIAEQTLPVAFERNILFIWVRHPTWMQQLWYFQDAIKEKVNGHVGKIWVREIKFTLSRRAATTPEADSQV